MISLCGPLPRSQLQVCFADRILLSDADLHVGQGLWTAYKDNNLEELARLAKHQSVAFPYLQEIVEAHIDRNTICPSSAKVLLHCQQVLYRKLLIFLCCWQRSMYQSRSSAIAICRFPLSKVLQRFHLLFVHRGN